MAGLQVSPTAASSPIRVAWGWPAPRQYRRDDEDAVLAEAIRFHDLSQEPVVKPPQFPRFEQAGGVQVFADQVAPLRHFLHDATRTLLAELAGPLYAGKDRAGKEVAVHPGQNMRGEINDEALKSIRAETLPADLANRLDLGVPEADAGRVAVRLMLSDRWRREDRVRLLQTPGKDRLTVKFRRFEDLVPRLAELRKTVRREAVETALRNSYGDTIVDLWGGDRVVDRPGHHDTDYELGGYLEQGETGVGLAEKLYQEFATSPFAYAHGKARVTESGTLFPLAAPGRLGGIPFELHLDVRRQVDRLANEVLPTARLPKPFAAWIANINTLEDCFLEALRGPAGRVAAEVGLPWALALTATLRAYLYLFIGHVMTLAVPIEPVHENDHGNMAVALWEALAGQRASHPTDPGHLVPSGEDGGALLGVLSQWRLAQGPTSFLSDWPSVAEHAAAARLLGGMADEPCLLPSARGKEPDRSVTIAAQFARWNAYPPARLDILRPAGPGRQLRVGASLTAQCQLYAAGWIMGFAVQELGIPDWDGRTDEPEGGSSTQLHAPDKPPAAVAPALMLGDGSFPWGGRIPPHLEHRNGAIFDIDFGPSCLPWLRVTMGESLQERVRRRLRGTAPALFSVTRTRDEVANKSTANLVFDTAAKSLMAGQLDAARERLNRAPSKEDAKVFAEIEARLAGFPHVFSTLAAQQVHAAAIPLLLAGPVQVIHASPLAHLRAMRAVRDGLAGGGGAHAAAGPLTRSVRFVFAPTDHHDHWHVNFQAHGDNVPHPDRIGDLLPLWSALGIDLVPLARALRDLVLQPAWPQVEQERATLVGFLEDYVPQPGGVRRLHSMYAAANTMLTPMGGAKPSKELKQAIAETDAVLTVKQTEIKVVDPDRGE